MNRSSIGQRSETLALAHLLKLVELCRSTADELRTDDLETLEELLRSLDIAEICLMRLQADAADAAHETGEAALSGSGASG